MSPTYIRRNSPDGLQPVDYSAKTLREAAVYEPDGVYAIANTFNMHQVLKLDAHLDRLENSAQQESIPLRLDRAELRRSLRQMIDESGFGDVRYRITVPQQNPGQMIISLEPFTPLAPAIIHSGVRCVLAPGLMRRNPAAKTSDWMLQRDSFERPDWAYEALLVSNDGRILEGFTSNFYAILNNELRTAGEDVLPGIAQQIVFAVAPDHIILRRDAVHVADVPQISEAFITSASRGMIPVVQIDDQPIGDGTPGPRTMAIRRAYERWVEAHLEEL